MSSRARALLLATLIVAATAAAYANSLYGDFLFDDIHAIVENPHIRKLWPISYALSAPAQSSLAGRPIVSLSFALNNAISGMSEGGFHAGNLLIHILSALALFGFLRQALRRALHKEGRTGDSLAALIAALWAVHPLQTESVTYIVQRSECLMGLFYLLTLYLSARSFASPQPLGWQAAAVVCCALGMGCKEVMATAPIIVLIYDGLLVSRSFPRAVARAWPFYAALASTWLILAAIVAAAPRSETAGFGMVGVSPFQYAATQFGVIVHYLRLSLWPHPLCIDYAWPIATSAKAVLPPAALIFALLALTLWAARRRSPWAFAGAAYFLILAPSSSFIPIKDMAFEHRMYLPLAAVMTVLVFAALAAARWMQERLGLKAGVVRPALAVVVLLVVAGATWGTIQRNRDYQHGQRMWEQVVRLRPDNARAHSSLGIILAARGDFDGAIRACSEALRADPRNAEAPYNLGKSLAEAGRLEEAAAAYRQAIQIAPGHFRARTNLGEILSRTGRFDEAIEQYRSAIQAKPAEPMPRRNLAQVLLSAGRNAEAAEALTTLLVMTPDDLDALCDLGTALARVGRTEESAARFADALRRDPEHIPCHYARAVALDASGRLAEAAEAYRRVLALDSRHADAHCNLGGVLARGGDREGASQEYLAALAIDANHVAAHYNLGSALASEGRMIDARRQFEEILRIEPGHAAARRALDAIGRSGP